MEKANTWLPVAGRRRGQTSGEVCGHRPAVGVFIGNDSPACLSSEALAQMLEYQWVRIASTPLDHALLSARPRIPFRTRLPSFPWSGRVKGLPDARTDGKRSWAVVLPYARCGGTVSAGGDEPVVLAGCLACGLAAGCGDVGRRAALRRWPLVDGVIVVLAVCSGRCYCLQSFGRPVHPKNSGLGY